MTSKSITFLNAEDHLDRYREDPIIAAHKLAEIWCKDPTSHIDVWGCDFPCKIFFEEFWDRCDDKGMLKESIEVWWLVHNSPGPEPCFHNCVVQWTKDYAKSHRVEFDRHIE